MPSSEIIVSLNRDLKMSLLTNLETRNNEAIMGMTAT